MEVEDLKKLIEEIVEKSYELVNKHTLERNAQISYASIFAQTAQQYDELHQVIGKVGTIFEVTPSGAIFKIKPLNTIAGPLQLLKIRRADETNSELGDVTFTAENYEELKKDLSKPNFKLISQKRFELIELTDKYFNVKAYFMNSRLGLTNNPTKQID